jgi:hypothetical protein
VSRLILSAWKHHQELEKLGIKYGPRKKLQKLLDNLKDDEALASGFAALLQSISNVLERLCDSLKEMVLDLFDSVSNFLRNPFKASHSLDTSICNSRRAQKNWLSSSHMCYANWQKTVKSVENHANQQNCKDMRKYARQVLLVVHPDKFDLLHPQCKQGSSAHLAAEFNNQYNRLKDKCRMK